MLAALNQLISRLFDGVLWPLSDSPRLALVWIAILLGLLVGYLMRWLTPRNPLNRLAQQTRAELLAIRLFVDQLGSVLRSLVRLIWLCLLRVACFLPATLLLLPAGLLVEAQLESRFGHRGLMPGDSALVKMQFKDETWPKPGEVQMVLEEPLHRLRRESLDWKITGPFHDPSEHVICWQVNRTGESIHATQYGPISLKFSCRGQRLRVPLSVIGDETLSGFAVPQVTQKDSEKFGPLIIDYPAREFQFAGLSQPWWVMFWALFIPSVWLAMPKRSGFE